MDNLYINLLEEMRNKKMIIFGCGQYFTEFLLRYPSLIGEIEFILDNDPQSDIYTYDAFRIPVILPGEISKIDLSNYVILFCASQWKEMKEQLDGIYLFSLSSGN